MNIYPSSSITPMSPVWNHLPANACSVAYDTRLWCPLRAGSDRSPETVNRSFIHFCRLKGAR